jgi:PleD family two-component response regulator
MATRTDETGAEETREDMQILIVEDQRATADMLRSYFETQGYTVVTVGWGEDAIDFVEENIPDLVMLDIRLPDIDGYEVCRHLRTHERTKNVPIIFLTERREKSARLKGLKLGAVDYITKPFDIQELRLRVRNVLHRARGEVANHPITNLPTGPLVDQELDVLLRRPDWAVLSVGLRGLKRFSEDYGFVARDDVLRSVAAILTHVRDDHAPGAFVGHLDATDLLLILEPDQVDHVRQLLETRLNEALSFFYPYTDRQKADSDLPLSFSTRVLGPPTKSLRSVEDLKEALAGVSPHRSKSGISSVDTSSADT